MRQLVAILMHPKELAIADFSYDLPQEKIAFFPLEKRDDSRLLVYKNNSISDSFYHQLPGHLPENSLLVFNNTKVVEARLLFQKATGGVIELFCIEPHEQYADITTALSQKGTVQWQCMVGGASKWKHGQVLEKKLSYDDYTLHLQAKYFEKKGDSFTIEFNWQPAELSFAEVLHLAGAIPLPPYIKRNATITDKERYQTLYARYEGSVAAPTAGLHFTDDIFKKLETKNIRKDYVTLHVGAGTFKPVKSDFMQDHEMHAEYITVSKVFIENLIGSLHHPVIAVGTTSLRTLESLYWLGVKFSIDNRQWPSIKNLMELSQWECYDMAKHNITIKDSLQTLLDWMIVNGEDRLIAKTQIIIAPGYKLKIATGLITNFHQPQSTLLLLVAAVMGPGWKKIYTHALEQGYRFLSYGDGCLLLPG